MSRPLIGITGLVEPASWRVWRDVPATLVAHDYVRQVEEAGGVAVVVPPLPADRVGDLLPRLDGLVLSGGVDVDPRRYGDEPHPLSQEPRPERDESELALVRAAVDTDLPLLGVCRGMQVMAVAGGGALIQHLPDEWSTLHLVTPGTYGAHEVELAVGSRLHSILGDRVMVATYHHQGVRSHPGYRACGWSVPDRLLEAFEAPGASFRVGIQWHPEVGDDGGLFEALVAAATGG